MGRVGGGGGLGVASELVSLGDRPSSHHSYGQGSPGDSTREHHGSSSDQDADPSWTMLPGRNKTSNRKVGDGTLPRHRLTNNHLVTSRRS